MSPLSASHSRTVPSTLPLATKSLQTGASQYYHQLQETLRQATPSQSLVTIFGIKLDLSLLTDPVRNLVLGTDPGTSRETTLITTTDLRQLITTVTEILTTAISGITDFVSTSLMALFISFLVLLDLPNLEGSLLGLIPPTYHREYLLLIHRLSSVWQGFFRGQAIVACLIAALT